MSKPAKSIGQAMQLAEEVQTSEAKLEGRDMWKDLSRVYVGRELNDAILERCEQMGVNVKALKASIQRKRDKR